MFASRPSFNVGSIVRKFPRLVENRTETWQTLAADMRVLFLVNEAIIVKQNCHKYV